MDFGLEVSRAARSYIGQSFVNHAAIVHCGSRARTYPGCMDIGLGPEGFDCSGLVIRAMSDAMGVHETDWAFGIRHVFQMARKGKRISAEQLSGYTLHNGLLYVFDHVDEKTSVSYAHIGIYDGNEKMIHARRKGFELVAKDVVAVRGTSKRFSCALSPLQLLQAVASV